MRVLLTDRPWSDINIERDIFADSNIDIIEGSVKPSDIEEAENLVRISDPDAILTCWAPISASVIEIAKNLKIISRFGTGIDNVDIEAATRHGAYVTNVPEYCTEDVADHAAALTLASLRGIVHFDRQAKQGHWQPETASFDRISDLVVGILGYGKIGRALGKRLKPFGCRILAYSRSLHSGEEGVEVADLEMIQANCDVIVVLVPSTPQTAHLIGREFLRNCDRQPLIVNVSRGSLVDNEALLEALASKRVRGAALDVVEGEPNPPSQILEHPSIVATPHVAYFSNASVASLRRQACEEIVRVLAGNPPLNPCNMPRR